jgi:hypothetical protein
MSIRVQAKVVGRVIASMQKEVARLDGPAKIDVEEQIEVMKELRDTLWMLIRVKRPCLGY